MSPKSVHIKVDPLTRPRIPLVVAFPGEVMEFAVDQGAALVFIPGGNQIFDELSGNDFLVMPDQSVSLTVSKDVFSSERRPIDESQGALVVKYAVHCEYQNEFYFAEGDSPPKIIIPKFP